MQSVEPKINKDVYNFLSPLNSINQKKSYGGTSLKQVKNALIRAKKIKSNMKFFLNLILLLLLIISGCGKKTSLEKYPNSNYRNNIKATNE